MNWKVKCLLICIVLFFVSFKTGYVLFPNAVRTEGASFVPIGIAILSGLLLVYSVRMALWKQVLIGVVIPHAFTIYMIMLSLSGGYLIGCVSGM